MRLIGLAALRSVVLIERLFHVKRNLNRLYDLTSVRAGLCCFRDAGGLIKSFDDFLDKGLDRDLGCWGVHVRVS
jgi:hypothetical protein